MVESRKPQRWGLFAVVAAVALMLVYQIWLWEIERVEVPPGKFLVLVHRWGKNLDEGQIVAPDDSYKGVMFEVNGRRPALHQSALLESTRFTTWCACRWASAWC